MRILGIETSCDETAVAVVDDGVHVHSNVISSSKATFEKLAGVIPEQAARAQLECMLPVIGQALSEAKTDWTDLDGIAVTKGPGLLGSLLVGTATARALSVIHDIPLIGVHHTLGHLSSTWLEAAEEAQFPLITLSASGGHTDLWLRTSHITGVLLGRTRDDAAGEAFDKGASMLGLPYPGGPHVARASEGGNEHAYKFPMPLKGEDTLDFSFSGLKTSLKYLLRDLPDPLSNKALQSDLAASFQFGICNHLLDRLMLAIEKYPSCKEVHIVGGVSANLRLRALVTDISAQKGIAIRVPAKIHYCTDNGAMIAAAGAFLWKELGEAALAPFPTQASLPLEATLVRQ